MFKNVLFTIASIIKSVKLQLPHITKKRYTIHMRLLEEAILSTLSYYDIFDYPLTSVEIWKWLYVDGSGDELRSLQFHDIQKELDSNKDLKAKITFKLGFYFIKGRQAIVATRMSRYLLAEKKFHKAKRIIRILRFVPYIKMIGICNTLAYNNSRSKADIDLFIITRRGRIWQSRFFVAGFLKIFGLRPSGTNTQDTLCASFFIDEDHLDLESLAIKDDIYLPYWITQVVPVYDEGCYQQFMEANSWIKIHLPNVLTISPTSRRRIKKVSTVKYFLKSLTYLIPDKVFKNYQLKVMPDVLRAMANRDSRVVVRDYMLKFHDTDRRASFLEYWNKRRAEII